MTTAEQVANEHRSRMPADEQLLQMLDCLQKQLDEQEEATFLERDAATRVQN